MALTSWKGDTVGPHCKNEMDLLTPLTFQSVPCVHTGASSTLGLGQISPRGDCTQSGESAVGKSSDPGPLSAAKTPPHSEAWAQRGKPHPDFTICSRCPPPLPAWKGWVLYFFLATFPVLPVPAWWEHSGPIHQPALGMLRKIMLTRNQHWSPPPEKPSR